MQQARLPLPLGSAVLIFVLMVLPLCAVSGEPGPAVGDRFPHTLAALDQRGEEQELSTLMGERGLAVFFVRSADWCPFCQRQLAEVNDRLADFHALGLSVVSVSVDDVEKIAAFAASEEISYTLLADPAGDINEQLGIRDLQYPVGSAAFGVPLPVLYVIDRDNVVRARYMEESYRTRPNLDVVLAEVAELDF